MQARRKAVAIAVAATAVVSATALGLAGSSAAATTSAATSVTPGVTLDGSGGCAGGGTSLDGNGNLLSAAIAPGGGGASSSRPLVVERSGSVRWHGSTGSVITHHHWWVHVDGLPVRSGGSANDSRSTKSSGVEKVTRYLPSWLGLTGVFYVNGQISGTGGTCAGAVYVKLNGNPATGVLLWTGIALLLIGVATVFGALPRFVYTDVPPGPPSAAAPVETPGPEPREAQP